MRNSAVQSIWLAVIVLTVTATTATAQLENPDHYPGVWYRLVLDVDGEFVLGDGHGYNGGTWYYYPETGWWRQWFYNGPYSDLRHGELEYETYIKAYEVSRNVNAEVRFNWSTRAWSAQGLDRPPLPDDVPTAGDEGMYMDGAGLWTVDNYILRGSVEPIKTYTISSYNPEWVSIDIRGSNVYIYRGAHHQCVGSDGSTAPLGACCNLETGYCGITTQANCGGSRTWLGPNTTCDQCKSPEDATHDFGDAPDSAYATLLGSDGARHTVVSGVYLGSSVDAEVDGLASSGANGDDVDGSDDEDGVTFANSLYPGSPSTVSIIASTDGYINAWIDFDQNGTFSGVNEQIFTDEWVSSGSNSLTFDIPGDSAVGDTYARFRFNTLGVLDYYGEASDGEVEDYRITLGTDAVTTTCTIRLSPKWCQGPVASGSSRVYEGWNQRSDFVSHRIIADDWSCDDSWPVTGFHWWGSFAGWTGSQLPSNAPLAFHIAIWSDAVNSKAENAYMSSSPGTLIWETYSTGWVWSDAGELTDPQGNSTGETCFQFTSLMSQDEWFYGNSGNTYWVSIAAIYDTGVTPSYPWGWTSRHYGFGDAAVTVDTITTTWPPSEGAQWSSGQMVQYPTEIPWDMSFEMITNNPSSCSSGGGSSSDGIAPVYRFWSGKLKSHFYTIFEDEKNLIIAQGSDYWAYEGIAFYAYPPSTAVAGTVPVYRFWSNSNMCHYYTTSESEKDELINGGIWQYEGVAWYAYN
jgi:hypothetical protein